MLFEWNFPNSDAYQWTKMKMHKYNCETSQILWMTHCYYLLYSPKNNINQAHKQYSNPEREREIIHSKSKNVIVSIDLENTFWNLELSQ
jgi:hypothetical protein